jgi:hypothetical protein
MKDYNDIKNWNDKPVKFFKFFADKKSDVNKSHNITKLDFDIIKVYALLKSTISQRPNGFYTSLQEGLPLDNMIWWDFLLESDIGFIQIWRTSARLEAMYSIDDKDFNINKFIERNLIFYKEQLGKLIKNFEKHTVFINHYKSYKDCVEFSWKEISTLDIQPPKNLGSHVVNKLDLKYFKRKMDTFSKNSIKFHTLGKSLVLNAAFQIDSFLNLIIRLGASQDLKDHSDILNKHLNSSFKERLKNLKFYSIILNSEIDLEHISIKDALDLMTLRNKYVHFDSNSTHNKLGEVLFDNDFPLHPASEDAPAIKTILDTFHNPNFGTVEHAYNTVNKFSEYISSLFLPDYVSTPFLLQSKSGHFFLIFCFQKLHRTQIT